MGEREMDPRGTVRRRRSGKPAWESVEDGGQRRRGKEVRKCPERKRRR
jgi:hypothetical protein